MLALIRILLAGSVFFAVSFLIIPFMIFRPFHPDNGPLYCRLFAPLCLKILGIKVITKNIETLKESAPCIYLGNHQGSLDVCLLGYVHPWKTVSIGKKELIYIPGFGQVYWLSGHVLIDRFAKNKAISTLEKVKEKLQKNKVSIWVLPEGTRSRGRGLLPFKKGAFHMAISAQVPLKPIVISSFYGKMNYNRWHAGTILIEALDEISTKGKTSEDLDDLINQAHHAYENKLAEMDKEIAILDNRATKKVVSVL